MVQCGMFSDGYSFVLLAYVRTRKLPVVTSSPSRRIHTDAGYREALGICFQSVSGAECP